MPHSLKLLSLAALPFFALGGFAQAASAAATAAGARGQTVVVDVVATDKSGHPVSDLKQADFTVQEDGAPQALKAFQAHPAPAASASFPAPSPMPASIYENYSPLPAGTPVNVLLIDELNTPDADRAFLHDQLLQYVKNASPATPVAIFVLSDRLIMLQGFNSDPAILKAAMESASPASGSLPASSAVVNATGGPDPATLLAGLQHMATAPPPLQPEQSALATMDAMEMIARYLSGYPGRKNLIWFSGSFPVSVLPDGSALNPFAALPHNEDEYRAVARLFGSNQIAVYPIYANSTATASPSADSGDAVMQQMAQATGGQAFTNTKGLADTFAQAVKASAAYYTLTYDSSHPGGDGAYRKIEVSLRRPGATLQYRRGYYTASQNHEPFAGDPAAGVPDKTMRLAMLRGAPDPTEIIFKASVLPSEGGKAGKLAPDNRLSFQAAGTEATYRNYVVSVAADPGGVAFLPQPGGKYKADLQAVVFVYNENGTLVNQTGKEMVTSLTLEQYKPIFAHGIQYHEVVSVPVEGAYYLRIGLHDINSDHVGAMEAPVAGIQNPSTAK